jgi:hypothetical protein
MKYEILIKMIRSFGSYVRALVVLIAKISASFGLLTIVNLLSSYLIAVSWRVWENWSECRNGSLLDESMSFTTGAIALITVWPYITLMTIALAALRRIKSVWVVPVCHVAVLTLIVVFVESFFLYRRSGDASVTIAALPGIVLTGIAIRLLPMRLTSLMNVFAALTGKERLYEKSGG